MALMMDKIPMDYEGEKKTWECIKNNLPDDIICYFNREVKGREFDFCLLIKDIGFMIIEVKGWNYSHIKEVKSPDQIILSNGEIVNSPKKQAKGYSFNLKNIMSENYNVDPLVMNMVCYPFLSEDMYIKLGLNIVSEPENTLFKEDIESLNLFTQKIINVRNSYNNVKYDKMSGEVYDKSRHHFESSYIIKSKDKVVKPYSTLSVYNSSLSLSIIDDIVSSYFKGTKQIVFTSSYSDLEALSKNLSNLFNKKNIQIKGNKLEISVESNEVQIEIKNNKFSIFNFEAFYVENYNIKSTFIINNGELSLEQDSELKEISKACGFNNNQYYVEHAPVDKDIQVKAGAGTGKTYSMISRIAFLCSEASGSGVYDISNEIAMLTFTADAALNMKSRLKQLYMNYFIVTNNIKYLDCITNVEKMRISTIHSLAKDIIQNTSTLLGVGSDFRVVYGIYERQVILERIFAEYLSDKNIKQPVFFNEIPIKLYDLKDYLLEFSKKLYEKGCDIKDISMDKFGDSPEEMPYFNEMIEKVIIETEKEYSKYLIENNSVNLNEYMIHLSKCITAESFNKNQYAYKYIFIDEFQDTDDAQIMAFINMQQKINFKFFIVGDLKQSIYRFRGATMDAFEKMGCDNNEVWKLYTLNINYRSDSRLLANYSRLFSYLGKEKLLPYNDFDDILTGVNVFDFIPDDEVTKKITCEKNESYDKLFEVIELQKQRIKDAMQNKTLSSNERTIAILTRDNSEIKKIVKAANNHKDENNQKIVIESDNGQNLYKLPSSTDLCKLTAALCNPYNVTYLYGLLNSNYINGEFDIKTIIGLSADEKLNKIVEFLDKYFMATMRMSWGELIKEVQNEPILKSLKIIYERTRPWLKYSNYEKGRAFYRANYELIFEELSSQNKYNYLTLDSINESLHILIATLSAKSRNISIEEDLNDIRIVCLTIHKSKGLEYGSVILSDTSKSIDNIDRNGIDVIYLNNKVGYCISNKKGKSSECFHYYNDFYEVQDEIREKTMEEVRILYVAMTRAINSFTWLSQNNSKTCSWNTLLEEM